MVSTSPTDEDRASAHGARLAPYVDPHLERRRAGVPHPVHDFLFTYYSFSPAKLLDWQPGWPTSGSQSLASKRRGLVVSTLELLRATASRTPTFACFGMHEWAMVHRADETRHPRPLRLGRTGTDGVVESHRITCSHFDAYRFFTPSATPLNELRPTSDRTAHEQPGCLHATMDLYKHAFRLWPLVGSDLVADCFELAWDVRVVDMRAAPYDLTGTTLDPTGEAWTPIEIETTAGKQEYAAHQRRFADRAAPLRGRLVEICEELVRIQPTDRASPAATSSGTPTGRPNGRRLSGSRADGARPDYRGAMDDRVLANFLGPDGRLKSIPTKLSKLMVVLDRLAQEFEPGQTYPEPKVNEVLQRFHPDYAALRRYLVENGFMTREDSLYWRSGGTFEV